MAALSISQAWTETGQFLAREARLVLPVALLLLAIPPAANQLLLPMSEVAQPSFGELMLDLAMTLLTVIASVIGGIAISHLALTPGASVGEALRRGLSRCLSLLGASFLIAIPLVLIAFLLFMLMAPSASVLQEPLDPANLPPGLASAIIILTILTIAFWVKISMGTPVASAEQAGPLQIIRRSWNLTTGHYWPLLGAFLALMLVSSLVVWALSRGIGVLIFLAAGPPTIGNGSYIAVTLVDVVLQTIMATVLIVLVARIYAQLSGRAETDEPA